MDTTYLLDWANLLLRWAHVIVAIAWIGSSFYFVFLDSSLEPPTDPVLKDKGVGGELWAVHGGGFYNPQKYTVAPKTLPEKLHWFFWESYSTWLTGFGLFTVLYLFQARTFLIDPRVHAWSSPGWAVAAALGQGVNAPVRGVPNTSGIFYGQSGADAANNGTRPAAQYTFSNGYSSTFNPNDLAMSYPDSRRYGALASGERKVFGTDNVKAYADLSYQSVVTGNQLAPSATGAGAVKMEGGAEMASITAALARSGAPVIGHIGLTPQSALAEGRPRVKGRAPDAAEALIADALALEAAGAAAIVIELVPAELAAAITARLHIPTIGIGAGSGCSGQVQVIPDLLGLLAGRPPRHARSFANLRERAISAIEEWRAEVEAGTFPGVEESVAGDEVLRSALGATDPSGHSARSE